MSSVTSGSGDLLIRNVETDLVIAQYPVLQASFTFKRREVTQGFPSRLVSYHTHVLYDVLCSIDDSKIVPNNYMLNRELELARARIKQLENELALRNVFGIVPRKPKAVTIASRMKIEDNSI
jgi:hypothetical protein